MTMTYEINISHLKGVDHFLFGGKSSNFIRKSVILLVQKTCGLSGHTVLTAESLFLFLLGKNNAVEVHSFRICTHCNDQFCPHQVSQHKPESHSSGVE